MKMHRLPLFTIAALLLLSPQAQAEEKNQRVVIGLQAGVERTLWKPTNYWSGIKGIGVVEQVEAGMLWKLSESWSFEMLWAYHMGQPIGGASFVDPDGNRITHGPGMSLALDYELLKWLEIGLGVEARIDANGTHLMAASVAPGARLVLWLDQKFANLVLQAGPHIDFNADEKWKTGVAPQGSLAFHFVF